jgi:hypothetical protein
MPLQRFIPGQGLDPTFRNGLDPLVVNAAAAQSDNKILVAGPFNVLDGYVRPKLARLNPDGTLDPSFDIGACELLALPLPSDVAVEPAGDVLYQDSHFGRERLFRFAGDRQPFLPQVRDPPFDLTVAEGAESGLTAWAWGYPAPAFQWQYQGLDLPGATNVLLPLSSFSPDMAGRYSLS